MARKLRASKRRKKSILSDLKKLKSSAKKISRNLAKRQKRLNEEREKKQIERLLGEDFDTLSQARRALKKEARPVSKRKKKKIKTPQEPERGGVIFSDEWEEWAITFSYDV